MCFSATASFTASAVLAAVGGLTMRSTANRSQLYFAAIPFLFAIQQFSEGIVWLYFKYQVPQDWFFYFAKGSFLTFAFLVWPIWIPLSVAKLEWVEWRQKALYALLGAGVILGLINIYYSVVTDSSVHVVNKSLKYLNDDYPMWEIIVYPLIVLIPFFISSYRGMVLAGVLVAAVYLAALFFYNATFISVWCFFAAIVSLLAYKVIKDNQAVIEPKFK